MAANNTGDDITFGQTNAGQDGTELRADVSPHGNYGNDYVLQLTVSPLMQRNDVDGLRSNAIKQGRGVVGTADSTAGVWGICRSSSSSDIGVRGENVFDDNAPGHQPGQGQGIGVFGTVNLQNGVGVKGENSIGTGVSGISHGDSGIGVEGVANNPAAGTGVHGSSSGNQGIGIGVQGDAEVSGGMGIGIVGTSGAGVGGVFSTGPAGVAFNEVPPGRAGVFLSATNAPQVRLVPHDATKPPTSIQTLHAVQALISKGHEAAFPANGRTGDLLCTIMTIAPTGPVEVGALWFCERGGVDRAHPAIWRQVLLGPAISGQG